MLFQKTTSPGRTVRGVALRAAWAGWVVALGVGFAVACGSEGSSADLTTGAISATSCDGTLASVQKIFDGSCAVTGCHTGSEPAAAMDLSRGKAEEALVGAGAGTCDGWKRVVPGAPEASLLWRKIYSESPPCGETMPLGHHMRAVDLGCVREWIRKLPVSDAGAVGNDDGGQGGTTGCVTCGGGKTCIDFSVDPNHCGSCGTRCPAGSSCDGAKCTCDGSLAFCDSACVDLQSSQDHCGSCGSPCASGGLCVAGQCICSGTLETCGGACVDTQADPANCGGCGKACEPTAPVCLRGACAAGCGSLTNCGGTCADLKTSARNCGACGSVCASGAACVAGQCTCPAGTADCGGACKDVFSDPNNCGACGKACSSGQICSVGKCECPGGGTSCGGRCVDTRTDTANCGACGNVCGGGQTCTSGACACLAGAASLAANVQPIFTKSCALRGCHGSVSPKEGLNLSSGAAYSNLVRVAARECTGIQRVEPGNPAASYLMNKLMGVKLCSGSQMPKAGSSLPKTEVDTIGAWICSGAANN